MSQRSTDLTNLNPKIAEYRNSIRNRFVQENKIAKRGQIVFVGSSLMEMFPIDKMQSSLGLDKVIYNRGIRATTTAELLEGIDICILDLKPSKVFINIGSNDIGFGVPEKIFLSNYEEILGQIKLKLPQTKVFVMAYYPVNTMANFGEQEASHKSLFEKRSNEILETANQKVSKLAQKFNFEFINVNDGLTDPNGNLKKEFTFDGAHLCPAGYEIVVKNLREYL